MMNDLRNHETELVAENGQKIHLAYEETGDILEVVFEGVKATATVELTDNIVLRFDRQQASAAGLTIVDFSVLASPSELGVRSFALTGLSDLPDSLRQTVVHLLTSSPVNYFLKVMTFYASPTQQIPLTYVERSRELALAA